MQYLENWSQRTHFKSIFELSDLEVGTIDFICFGSKFAVDQCNWSEKRRCDILSAYLRDRAAEYFDEMPDRNNMTLENLKEALIEHLMSKEARSFYYADLYSRQQG